jgi:hypothetical protein
MTLLPAGRAEVAIERRDIGDTMNHVVIAKSDDGLSLSTDRLSRTICNHSQHAD